MQGNKIDTLFDVTDHFLGELEMWLGQRGFKSTPPSGTGYSVVQDEGIALAPRHVLDFVGAQVTASDDATNNRTLVTVTSAASNFTVAAKPADTSRSSLTTPTADPDLKFTIGASNTEVWFVECKLLVNAADTLMASLFGWSFPTGVTMFWGASVGAHPDLLAGFGAAAPSGASPLDLKIQSATQAYTVNATGTFGLSLEAIVFGGGTAGNVTLLWSQQTTDAGTLKLRKGSLLRATKVLS